MPDRIDETLTAIVNETWLTATDEPNRQHGLQRRQYISNLIRQKLTGMKRSALNNALSLHVSRDDSLQNQKLRRGVRAIMLAQFALKGIPTQAAVALKQRWLNQPEDVLRRGFLASLPAFNDANDPARLAWDPANFTDPNTFPNWRRGPINFNYQFIVTCLPADTGAQPTLAAPDFTIAQWAAISTAVIDQSNSIMYGYYGFVLNVPAENILIAHNQDQDVRNHLGTAMTRNISAEANMSPIIKASLLSQHLTDLFAVQGRLKSPFECIQQNRNGKWNEVVVAGRSPTTGRATTVAALFYRVATNHQFYIKTGTTKSPITSVIEDWVEECADWNDLPIIYIPDSSGRLG